MGFALLPLALSGRGIKSSHVRPRVVCIGILDVKRNRCGCNILNLQAILACRRQKPIAAADRYRGKRGTVFKCVFVNGNGSIGATQEKIMASAASYA